jgi:ribosomal protein S18 acetylase RimI-like enzyme
MMRTMRTMRTMRMMRMSAAKRLLCGNAMRHVDVNDLPTGKDGGMDTRDARADQHGAPLDSAWAQGAPLRRIHLWQHGRALRQMERAYSPGTDALVDQIRVAGFFTRLVLLRIVLPLYFAREQGWMIPDKRGAMAAIIYLRRNQRRGVRVLHVDDINVDARYRRLGLAQRLMDFAEATARRERRPFLKLAVTVANIPAVTLYKRLGYHEQQYRFFSYDPDTVASHPPATGAVTLRELAQRRAWRENQRFYRTEMQASDPGVAELMVTYYPRGAGGTGVPGAGALRYAIEDRGQTIGYGDAYRRGRQWNVRLSLAPDCWGNAREQEAIQLLTSAVRRAMRPDDEPALLLHVPSPAHLEALVDGADKLAQAFDMSVQTYPRMIMVKSLEKSS